MTDSNRTRISYAEEVSWGTTPVSPTMQEVRLTSESFIKNIENIVSEELRHDRQVTDLVQSAKDAGGGINIEFSYGSYDDLLLSALFSSGWSTAVDISATDIAADAAGSKLTSTSTDFTTSNIVAGMFIKVGGFTGETSNNRFYRVTEVTDENNLAVYPAPTDDAAGETVTISGSYIRNGTTQNSFTIEKGFLDASEYFVYTGMIVSEFNLNLETQRPVTGSFNFIGKDGSLSDTPIDASPTASSSNDIMNAINNVASIREDSTEVTSPNYVRSLSISLNNNLRKQYAVGSDALIGVGAGKVDLTGRLDTYFGNSDVMDKFIAGSETSVDFTITDSDGNTYIFDMPRIKFDSANVVAQGQDQDVMAEMNYRAIRDSTYGYTIQICKF